MKLKLKFILFFLISQMALSQSKSIVNAQKEQKNFKKAETISSYQNFKEFELSEKLNGMSKVDVHCVNFSSDGNTILSGNQDGDIQLWDSFSGKSLLKIERWKKLGLVNRELPNDQAHFRPVTSVNFSFDGKRIISASRDTTIRIWNSNNGELINILSFNIDGICPVNINRQGNKIVSGCNDYSIKIWDSNSGSELNALRGHKKRIASVNFSPNGSKIVSGSFDKTIKIWDLETGLCIQTFTNASRVTSVNFSPDGNNIVASNDEGNISIWNAKSGKLLVNINGHESIVNCVVFSPDGDKFVSCSYDKTIKIWQTLTGVLLQTLVGHTDVVKSVNFNFNGTKLVSSGYGGEVKIWANSEN